MVYLYSAYNSMHTITPIKIPSSALIRYVLTEHGSQLIIIACIGLTLWKISVVGNPKQPQSVHYSSLGLTRVFASLCPESNDL